MMCPDCMSESTKYIGQIIYSNFFGGKFVDFDFPKSSLYHCLKCQLKFKFPVVDEDQLIALYEKVDSDAWVMSGRNDFRLVLAKLSEIGTQHKRVLDVGCNRGDLLASIPEPVERFGIEPNIKQHQSCYSNGFKQVWASMSEITESQQTFDIITMTDVLEHVCQPAKFIREVFSCLNPGGTLLITTGDSNSLLWKVFSQNNWYSFYQEHVSFASSDWLLQISHKLGVSAPCVINFSYVDHGIKSFIKHTIMAAVMGTSPSLYKLIFRALGFKVNEIFPFGYGLTRDHIMATLRKDPQSARDKCLQ